jgi:hypothetical protein
MTCCTHNCQQGKTCPKAPAPSLAAIGLKAGQNPMKSPVVIGVAAVLALIAVGMVMERMGIPISWPF